MRKWWMGCALLLVCLAPALAQDIPPPLQDWQAWVLHDHPQHACPFLTGSMPASDARRCLWPGELAVVAGKNGGHFQVSVEVDADSWLDLPGNNRQWPQQVTDRGRAIAVHDHQGMPTVRLEAGQHELSGTWAWSSMPTRLALPDVYGLVSLKVDGKPVPDFNRSGGSLTLGEAPAGPRQADALSLKVFRRLSDGLPPILETRMQLDVSGRAREVSIGPALPDGFVATRLDAPVPSRLNGDGKLRLQVRPGHWEITLAARGTAPLGKLGIKLAPKPWPQSEVWSYVDDPSLRQTRVEGRAVDATQAGVPGAWRSLPAFVISNNQGLDIKAGARAGQGGVSEKIRVNRQLWLDFNGDGFTARDLVQGTLDHLRRLETGMPWQLQRATVNGQPLLVGEGSDGARGVEVRDRYLNLDAGLYLPRSSFAAMPLAAWQLPMDSLDVDLQLPPGYRLLGAPGADQSNGSWVAGWTLLDLFLVALIALLCGRLLGWPVALLAIAYLVLAHDESYAPYLTVLLTAALALLARALPTGRLRVVAHGVALTFVALAVLWAIPYAGTQLRDALYPQLESSQGLARIIQNFANDRPRTSDARRRGAESLASRNVGATMLPAVVEGKSMMAMEAPPSPQAPPAPPADVAPDLSPLAATNPGPVQAGPGIPDWNVGNRYRLHWSGPVTAQQNMRLLIAPAWLVRLLRILSVVALLLLLARLLARLLAQLLPTRVRRWRLAGGGAALLLAVLMSSVPGAAHAAETPSQAMLEQLEQRLLEPPQCAPDCALLAEGRLQTDGDRLDLWLQVQLEARVAVPMPKSGDSMNLLAVRVDGQPSALSRDGDQPLLRLERGVHNVHLTWHIQGDDLRISFSDLKPKRMLATASGWTISGLDDAHLAGDTISLSRQQKVAVGTDVAPDNKAQSFPPYVRLSRSLLMGTDWRIINTVQRIAPAQAGFSVSLPLLPGEHPLDEDARVEDGRITLSFSAGQQQARWSSRIEPFATFDIKAPPLAERSETWEVRAAPIWHVDATGMPPQPADGMLAWSPLPGETLHLEVTRPAAAPGADVAVDKVRLHIKLGDRARDTNLTLTARSTRGGEHALAVPQDATLTDARRDGQTLTLALRDGHVSLPLRPGSHDYTLDLRQAQGLGLVARTPSVDLKAAIANIDLQLDLPHDRWVLWTWGPQNGPAVLYWPQLILLVLIAWLLARFSPTPLRFHHWLLLGLGFSTFAWSAFALVAVWLILVGMRERAQSVSDWPRRRFNLMQIGLAALTLLALLVLIGAVPRGLLGVPDMHVAGNGSTAFNLKWMLDKSDGVLPSAGVFSLPLWCYKVAILAWALWLANALVGWLRWVFRSWSAGGYWRRSEVAAAPAEASQPATHAGEASSAED